MPTDAMTGLPSGVPPDDSSAFYDAQRKQMIASMLMGAMQRSGQTPQDWNSMKVVPKRGLALNLAPLLTSLMAGKAQKDAMSSQAGLASQLNQAYAPGGQPTSPGIPLQAAPPADPNSQDVQPIIQRLPGASLAQTAQATQPTYAPQNPRNPYGLPADVVRNLAMTNPEAYAKYLQGPEWAQQARAAGIPLDVAGRGMLTKATTIEGRPGASATDLYGRTNINADPSRGESYITLPSGQTIAIPIAGSADIQAQRAGLATAAQQANTPREIPKGGGATELGYPPTPPALRPQTPQPQMPPIAGATAPPPSVPRQPIATPSPQSGAWANVPKLQIPNTPGQSSDTFTQKNLEAASAKHAELVGAYGQAAGLANQQLQYGNDALRQVQSAEVGPMSDWLTANRQRLVEAGMPQSLVPGSGTVTPTLELNKQLVNLALQGAKATYGPRMTGNEVKLQTQEASPSVEMTRDAITSLIHQSNIKAQYAIQRASDYNRYRQMGGDPLQFEGWYESNRPLSRFVSQQQTPPAALQRLQQNPKLLADFKSKYGWDPTQ